MEYLIELSKNRPRMKVALFDFDGTISTLRQSWEGIMEPMMVEMIAGKTKVDNKLLKSVKEYIGESTGIQTIYQMQWLAAEVKKHGRNPNMSDDPWWYKTEYNRRLMVPVEERKASIRAKEKTCESFLVKGSERFLKALRKLGIDIYVASGTDHPDVIDEAAVLGLKDYFKEIAGAPVGKMDCSKEAVLRKLILKNKLKASELIVIGDGKVEINLGRKFEALTLGVASDEEKCFGINFKKRRRLVDAGAHAIVGDYSNIDDILNWIGV